jgi:hypothetical protein
VKSAAYDFAKFLVAAGVGAFGGDAQWCINYGAEPDAPGDCITVYDTGGPEPETEELDLLRPTLQVRVRCVDYESGYAKQLLIRKLLTETEPVQMETSRFDMVAASSDILSIGRDDSNRFLLTSNYRCIRQLN